MMNSLPPPPTAAVLAALEDRRRSDAHGTHFVDDQGVPILDEVAPGYPTANAAAAARWLHRAHPELWGTETPTPAKAASLGPETATEIMRSVREGRLTAEAATAAIARLTGMTTAAAHVPTTPTRYKTLTEAMAAARKGVAGADAEMRRFLK